MIDEDLWCNYSGMLSPLAYTQEENKVMKINKEELYKLYMEWVDQVTEECDWKTSFGPEEIVYAIAHILETNPHLYEKEKYN